MALTLNDLFAKMEETKEDSQYRVTMAYLEVMEGGGGREGGREGGSVIGDGSVYMIQFACLDLCW